MMKRLRGRNLAHPGCLVGVTLGLALGIILGAIFALHNVSLNMVLLIWLVLTVGLGAIGWIVGVRLTSRFLAIDEATAGEKGAE